MRPDLAFPAPNGQGQVCGAIRDGASSSRSLVLIVLPFGASLTLLRKSIPIETGPGIVVSGVQIGCGIPVVESVLAIKGFWGPKCPVMIKKTIT
ncbi:hypothetical protein CRG98_035719 [Punica granatum]|uniref:Uncharacterized protein n=1 Tax=Punica granatum TaxID=22663 RepID=A0A2I0IIS4_PUNGR|nr:hypothetical protein CRG98_035719 [Punica granatum]